MINIDGDLRIYKKPYTPKVKEDEFLCRITGEIVTEEYCKSLGKGVGCKNYKYCF